MHIDVYATYRQADEIKLREHSVVVIDILRATTTIVEALSNGARSVIPASEIDEAIELRRVRGGQTVLAGERNAEKIEGFDLGNSPLEFTPMAVQGKTIVLSTTNGSRAIEKVKNCDTVFIGAMRNRRAVVEQLMKEKKNIAIVCAGTEGGFSADDIYCAGAYVMLIEELKPDVTICDLGIVAKNFYMQGKLNPQLLQSTKHYSKLVQLGLDMDIAFCMEEDACAFVPQVNNLTIEI